MSSLSRKTPTHLPKRSSSSAEKPQCSRRLDSSQPTACVTDYFIEPSGRQYLVMDYVPGDDLRQIVAERKRPLAEDEALSWIEPVMEALAYLHGWINTETGQPSPIIHRDIKPANIKRTPNGRTVLVDFGLAKLETGEGTLVGARAVTPGYSPLEQYAGGTDTRSDIYALGATLYLLLTGVKPPDAPAIAARTPLTPPQKLNPSISRNTERVVLRAMQLHAVNRYQSIQEMYAALFNTDSFPTVFERRRSLSQTAQKPSPPPPSRRGGPISRSLLLALVLVGLVSVATVALGLRSVWLGSFAAHRRPCRSAGIWFGDRDIECERTYGRYDGDLNRGRAGCPACCSAGCGGYTIAGTDRDTNARPNRFANGYAAANTHADSDCCTLRHEHIRANSCRNCDTPARNCDTLPATATPLPATSTATATMRGLRRLPQRQRLLQRLLQRQRLCPQ